MEGNWDNFKAAEVDNRHNKHVLLLHLKNQSWKKGRLDECDSLIGWFKENS